MNYFNEKHEKIVHEYQSTDDATKRNECITELYPVFEYMSRSLLKMYGKSLPNMEDYVTSTILKMISAMDSYNKNYADKPTSAHRYLTTVAINEIKYQLKRHNRALDKPIKGSSDEELYKFELAIGKMEDTQEVKENWLTDYFKWFVNYFSAKIPELYQSEIERKIAREFMAIFQNVNNLDANNIWKKPIYGHIRNKYNLPKKTIHITQVRKCMYEEYKKGIEIWKKNSSL